MPTVVPESACTDAPLGETPSPPDRPVPTYVRCHAPMRCWRAMQAAAGDSVPPLAVPLRSVRYCFGAGSPNATTCTGGPHQSGSSDESHRYSTAPPQVIPASSRPSRNERTR